MDKARTWPIKGTLGVVLLLAAGLLLAGAFGGVSPVGFTSSGGTSASSAAPVATSRTAASNYLVTFSHGTSSSTQAAAITAAGATRISSIAPLSMDTIKVPAGSERDVLAALRANTNVAGISLNRNRQSEGSVDPAYPDQWNLPQIGWDQIYGSVNPLGSSTIAVLDTGVSGSTGDLNLGAGWSAFGTDPTVDPNGHGTAVASIAAATAGDGIGVAGVDFAHVTILPVQVLNANGLGLDSDIVQGVVWAADHGANVISMSFSNPGYSQALQDAINYAWSKGAVVVAATGNGGSDSPTYPAGDADVMGVAGTDQSDQPWASGNTGADTFIAAPATNIPADATDGSETSITGTSASAAEVAGAAALLMANDPSATNAIVDGRLARNADPVGTVDQTGNGRLNIANAIADTSTDGVTPLGAPGGGPIVDPYVAADATTITPATGGGAIPATASSDSSPYSTTLTGPVITPSGGPGAHISTGTIILTIPSGFVWDTGGTAPAATLTGGAVSFTSRTSTAVTFTVTTQGAQNGALTISGLRVKPTAASPLASGSITESGTATWSNPTTGSWGTLTETNATTTTITNDLSAATVKNQPYAVNFSVTRSTGSATPTGTVTVSDGTDSCSTSTLSGSGATVTGSCNLASTTSGSKTITATYSGDSNFGGSASTGTAHTVNAFGTATQLGFVVQPSSTAAGSAISPAVQVAVEDAYGNTVTSYASTSLTISSTNTAFSGDSSTLTATTSSGVATFSSIKPTTVQSGTATLTASSGSLTSATSSTFSVTASGGAIAERGLATFNNSGSASLTINKPTGVVAGDVLIATFMAGDMTSIPTVSGTGWTLVKSQTVESGGLQHTATVLYRVADGTEGSSFTFTGPSGTNKMSGEIDAFSGVDTTGGVLVNGSAGGPFDVTPSAMSFSSAGSTAVSATSITTASANAGVVMVVSAFDDAKSVGSYSAPNVTLTDLGYSNSGNGTVGAAWGVKSAAGATGAGSATLGSSQRWGAMLLALKPATGSANQLAFTTLPSNTTAGSTMSPSVVVQLKDQNGNNVSTSGVSVTLTLNTGSFAGGSTTTVSTDSSGKATFSNLQINAAGTYTITAAATSWTSATSNSFTIAKATPVFSSLTASQSIPYGTSSVTLSGTVSAGSAAPVNGETVSVKINGNTQTTTTTGGNGSFSINFSTATIPASVTAYTITYSYAGDSTLNAAADNTSTALTVNKAALTVTPDPQSRTYGQAAPSYTFSVTGFQNSENAGTASGYVAPSCTSDYTTATTVAQSPRTISCSGGSADNYSFSYNTANLTVGKASLTVAPDPQSRTYGQSAPSYTFSVTGFQNSETAGTASGYSAPSCTSDYTVTTTVAQSPRTISCSGGSANNYSFSYNTANLTVSKASLTVTPDPQSRSYGQAAPSYTFSVTGFQNSENAGTASGYVAPSCTSDYTTATTVAQSPRTISCSGGSANNYSFNTSATSSLTVGKASLTVTPDPQSRTYGQAAPSYTFSVTGFQNSENAGTASGYVAPSCTSDYTTATTVAQSPRTISCSGGSADNYSFSYNTANLTVGKATLTVAPDPQSRTYGQSAPSYTFSVTGFQNSETAGTASGYSAPSCTSDYTVTTTVAQSPRTISCSGGSANNYSFSYNTANLTVSKASLTVTPDPQSRSYGQAAPSYTFSVTGFQNSENAGTASGYVAPSCTSDYTTATTVAQSPRTISCSGGSANNYSFNTSATSSLTVGKASLTVTPDPQSRTYGQAAPSYTFSVTGFQNSENAGTASGYVAPSCTGDYTTATTVAQSPRTISCSGGSANNYSFSYNTANLTVGKASLTVTPDPQSRTYGQAAPSYTFSVTGFQNSENAGTASGYSAPSCSSDYTTTTTVAQSPRTISCSGGSADNYSFNTSATASLTVGKASLTVTPDPQSRTYGQAAPSYTFSVTGFQNSENAGTASGYVAPSCTSDYTTATTVAQSPRTITCSGGSANNYSFNISATASLTVGKASLTVTPDPQSRTYGQAAPSYTVSVTGFQNSENAGTASGYVAPSCASDYTVTTPVAQSPRTISCSGGSANNYSFSYNTANLTVSKASLTVTPDPQSRTYGQAAPSYTFSVTGFQNSQDAGTAAGYVAPSCSSDYTTTTPVAQSPRTISCSGGAADNYSFNTSATASLTVGKASLTVTPDPQAVTYGQAAPTYTFSVTGFQNSETAGTASGYSAPSCSSDYTTTTPVAQSPRTISCSGGSADNYSFNTSATANLTVNAANFTKTSDVMVNGQPTVGTTVTITNGVYSPTTTSRTDRWELCDSGGANCNPIGGATSNAYTPAAGDLGLTLRVVETVSRANYNDAVSISIASPAIIKGSFTTSTAVAINGTPTVDASTTVTAGSYSPAPASRTYQWRLCDVAGNNCSDIGGANSSSYTPVASEAGSTLRVVETVSLAGYNDRSSTSASAVVLKGAIATSTAVAITGTPTVGMSSSITPGTYTPSPTGSSYQWERCDTGGLNCSDIGSATSDTYTPVGADAGSKLRVVETVTKDGYADGSSTSAASAIVANGSISTSTAVSVSGTPTVGTASTITTGSYSPAPSSRSYQWQLCDGSGNGCGNIAGANSSSYTPVSGDVGSTLRVVETASKAGYNNGASTSSASPVVVDGDFTVTSAVLINGQPTVGTATTITAGVYLPSATTNSYQWELCDSTGANCNNIGSATSNTYTPVSGDVGSTVRVVETAVRAGYNDGSSTSNAVAVDGIFTANTAVAINGTPAVGTQSTITAGTYTPSPSARSYQWKQCDSSGNNCVLISGATFSVYTPVAADVGKTLRVVEKVTRSLYVSGSFTSAASAPVVKGTFVVTTQVSIFGYPKHGVTSKINQGAYTPTPTTRTYHWLRCSSTTLASCVTISGATAKTYRPGSADIGKRLRVVETVSKPGYNNLSVTSLASTKVT